MLKVHGSKILQAVSTATQCQGFHFLHCRLKEPLLADTHHSPMRFSRSGSRNWPWKVWMEEMLEKMFFTTSTGNVPLFASSMSLVQKT